MIPMGSMAGLLIAELLVLIGAVSLIALLIMGLRAALNPNYRLKFRPPSKKRIALIIALLLFSVIAAEIVWSFIQIKQENEREDVNRKAREQFTLQEAHPYGELTLPKGTWIKRFDAFDNGEENRAFRLTGLRDVKFPHPTQVAGVWVMEMDIYSTRKALILAQDQTILGQACKKGQVAYFDAPLIEYDVVAEFSKEEPDGANARFKPSQWIFEGCEPAKTTE